MTIKITAYEIQLQQDRDAEFIKIIGKDQQELVYCLHDLTNPEKYGLPVGDSKSKLELKYSRDKFSKTENGQYYIPLQDVFSDQIVQMFLIDNNNNQVEYIFTGNRIIPNGTEILQIEQINNREYSKFKKITDASFERHGGIQEYIKKNEQCKLDFIKESLLPILNNTDIFFYSTQGELGKIYVLKYLQDNNIDFSPINSEFEGGSYSLCIK